MHPTQPVSGIVLSRLSLTALLSVLLLATPRRPWRTKAPARTSPLSIVALLPTGLVFLTTANWTQPVRLVRRLALPAAIVVLAFAALYYLEHYYYPAHYR